MNIETWPRDRFVPYVRNPRRNDNVVDRMCGSIKEFGFKIPILVRSDGTVVDGHLRLKAAEKLGIDELPVILCDEWTEAQVKAFRLLANRSVGWAEWDEELLRLEMDDLKELDFDLSMTGFDEKEIVSLTSNIDLEDVDRFSIFSAETIIERAFEHYRRVGLPWPTVPIHACMEEINALSVTDSGTLLSTQRAVNVANTYHRHRVDCHVRKAMSLQEAFDTDKILRRVLRLASEYGTIGDGDALSTMNVVSGTQACSNFRPGFTLYIIRKYCPDGGVFLDTSTGYGGRLVGFMASRCHRYIGVDPLRLTHDGNVQMCQDLGFSERVDLINRPVEDVESIDHTVDIAFTSPPYFSKEHYSNEETQSWIRYRTIEDWTSGFLVPMIRLQHRSLKIGSFSVINIADVTIENKHVGLVDATVESAKNIGFELVTTLNYPLKRRFGTEDTTVAQEPVLVFRKTERKDILNPCYEKIHKGTDRTTTRTSVRVVSEGILSS